MREKKKTSNKEAKETKLFIHLKMFFIYSVICFDIFVFINKCLSSLFFFSDQEKEKKNFIWIFQFQWFNKYTEQHKLIYQEIKCWVTISFLCLCVYDCLLCYNTAAAAAATDDKSKKNNNFYSYSLNSVYLYISMK